MSLLSCLCNYANKASTTKKKEGRKKCKLANLEQNSH